MSTPRPQIIPRSIPIKEKIHYFRNIEQIETALVSKHAIERVKERVCLEQ